MQFAVAHPFAAAFGVLFAGMLIRRMFGRKKVRDVRGQVAIVTGASAGIGKDVCKHLAKRGAHVVLAARRVDRLTDTASELEKLGAASTLCVQCDITVEDDRKALIAKTRAKYGKLDVLVLNAGRGAFLRFDDSDEVFRIIRETMEINFFASVRLLQHALPLLLASKGNICFVSSLAGVLFPPYRTAYCASKHAVNGFCGTLRGELSEKGVTVTTVCPGLIKTEFHDRVQGNIGKPAVNASHFMTSEECARQIVEAIEYEVKELVMTAGGKFGVMVRPFFPEFIDALMTKAAKKSCPAGEDVAKQ